MSLFKTLGKLFKSEEDQAYNEAYHKKCVELARKKGKEDAKKKYKDVK